DLRFEPLPPERALYPVPLIKATSSSKGHSPVMMTDGLDKTYWQASAQKKQSLSVDFKTRREFGGLQINWEKGLSAKSFEVLGSMDGKIWETLYTVKQNAADASFIRLPEAEARYLKINLLQSNSPSLFGICEINFPDVKSTLSPNDFLIYTAKNSPKGNYPPYFLEQATYWTVAGVNNDIKEALINEYGMVEVDKGLFSVEPMVSFNGNLYNWSNVTCSQSMGNTTSRNFEFTPAVTWYLGGLELETKVVTTGEANKSSRLLIAYTLQNTSKKPAVLDFYLLLRPFQVNPYYQFLNLTGGVGKIHSISEADNGTINVDDKLVIASENYDAFGAQIFDEGNAVEMLKNGMFPEAKSATDMHNLAGGIIKYALHLAPGESRKIFLAVPFHEKIVPASIDFEKDFAETTEFWKAKTGHVRFNLPASADRIINTYRSNLAYILVNRDKAGIQPGSRSYERSWIRDGALTSSALLKSGIVTEVRDFINWYSDHLYENGKVPCVVDFRGPDPVPENDSHGQYIYLIREYFNFTHDTAFLQSKNNLIVKAVDYIESLVAQRSTKYFKNGNDSIRSLYGLMPESISHEGYSAKPMHSYWDDFFTMKGLKDAADIQHILGETQQYERICKIRDTFRQNLYNSINLAMKYKNIDNIPGCAELGDFDATSTTISLTPCNERNNLPKPQVYNTFEKYYEFFKNRRDGKLDWPNYTPYEN
ncbi:MAG TPA: discoidin domain-containing protein, partial [Bacteroidales bacterium]|nr:discoidin domain-containing protein [Bacteroidales bacterium]